MRTLAAAREQEMIKKQNRKFAEAKRAATFMQNNPSDATAAAQSVADQDLIWGDDAADKELGLNRQDLAAVLKPDYHP